MNSETTHPSKSWVDYSALDEMARRLRNANLWDNLLGDSLAMLRERIELLDRFSRWEGFEYEKVRRPFKSWEDCRRMLIIITSNRRVTFSDIPASIGDCLNLACALAKWEESGQKIPSDIRTTFAGHLVVEWSNPAKSIIIGSEPPTKETNPLTDDKIKKIRKIHATEKYTSQELADIYDVPLSTIEKLVKS